MLCDGHEFLVSDELIAGGWRLSGRRRHDCRSKISASGRVFPEQLHSWTIIPQPQRPALMSTGGHCRPSPSPSTAASAGCPSRPPWPSYPSHRESYDTVRLSPSQSLLRSESSATSLRKSLNPSGSSSSPQRKSRTVAAAATAAATTTTATAAPAPANTAAAASSTATTKPSQSSSISLFPRHVQCRQCRRR